MGNCFKREEKSGVVSTTGYRQTLSEVDILNRQLKNRLSEIEIYTDMLMSDEPYEKNIDKVKNKIDKLKLICSKYHELIGLITRFENTCEIENITLENINLD